jgi:hypothetical protein
VIVMTQYLLAVHPAEGFPLPPDEMLQSFADTGAFNDRLTQAGAFVFANGLSSAESATVVRESGGEILITDGPYTETKEHLGGFWIINAPDLDEALEWAKLATVACREPVEVRAFDERDVDELMDACRAAWASGTP